MRQHGDQAFLGCIPIQWDGIVGGIIGIPKEPLNQEKGISLYHDRFFVADTKNLLPPSLSFLIGVIDTTGLSLLLNREAFITDSALARLKNHFTLQLAVGLRQIAEHKKQTFGQVIKIWGGRLKWAAIESDAIFEQVGEYMQMSVCGEQLNMSTILDRYKNAGDQTRFIYMDNEPTQRQYTNMLSQFGFPVVETDNEIDFEFLRKFARKRKIDMEPADMSISSLIRPIENKEWERVIQEMSAFVESDNTGQINAIQTADFKMEDVPALITTNQDAQDYYVHPSRIDQLPEELKKILGKLKQTDRVLFLNVSHPLVLELNNLVASGAAVSGTRIKAKSILMRGLLNAAAIHSGNFRPSALNLLLQDMASALLFVAEQQNYITKMKKNNITEIENGTS
jgi:HSP90 family molecular chaperone